MDLDYLLALLSRRKYFVRLKGGFQDRFEKSLPLKRLFPVYPAENTPEQGQVRKELDSLSEKIKNYEKLRCIPTSCWTLRESENALMWSSYTSRLGVCVRSTVENFVNALDYSGYDLMIGKMAYHGYGFNQDDEAFSKVNAFDCEKELRFYFLSDQINDHTNGVTLTANPEILINEIILSPRIDSKASCELKEILHERYGMNVRKSAFTMD